jgi:hypothetical protein
MPPSGEDPDGSDDHRWLLCLQLLLMLSEAIRQVVPGC